MARPRGSHSERVREAYDAGADGFERSWSGARTWMRPGYEAFEAHVSPCRLLDLGCNFGLDSVRFAELGYTVTGIDLSPRSIARARARARSRPTKLRLRFEVADILELDADALGRFDAVWASFSLLHVARDELPDALARVASILVQGGSLFLAMSDAAQTVEELKPILGLVDARGQEIAAPIVHWAFDDLRSVVLAAGFELRWSQIVTPFEGAGGSLSLWVREAAASA